MIRKITLCCDECKENFAANGSLYYRDNFINPSLKNTELLCSNCIEKWKNKWQILKADFSEKNCVSLVDITLADGSVYEKLDFTPLDSTVVVGIDIPEDAQKTLFSMYRDWDEKRKKDILKDCTFKDEFMRTTFSCETYGGEKFENIAFRFNVRGQLETEIELPDYIKTQIIEVYKIYEVHNSDN